MKRLALFLIAIAGAQSHWPAQLEIDMKEKSWDAAVRVGSAIVEEIDAGRMFARFADVPEEARIRRMYADALDHTGDSKNAQRQRTIAEAVLGNREGGPGYDRRLANLKASVLAGEVDEPSSLPRGSVVVFWAKWCALCKPELEALSRFSRASVVKIDVDEMPAELRKYVPMESPQSAELPQLYVVDATGHIRFHVVGYEDDGFFLKKIEWMVERGASSGARL